MEKKNRQGQDYALSVNSLTPQEGENPRNPPLGPSSSSGTQFSSQLTVSQIKNQPFEQSSSHEARVSSQLSVSQIRRMDDWQAEENRDRKALASLSDANGFIPPERRSMHDIPIPEFEEKEELGLAQFVVSALAFLVAFAAITGIFIYQRFGVLSDYSLPTETLGWGTIVGASVLTLTGELWFFAVARKVSMKWAVGCLLAAPVKLAFLILFKNRALAPFSVVFLGYVMIGLALYFNLGGGQ